MRALFLLFACLYALSANAEVFRWKDANGNTVFGDNPPESVRANEVELPILTVADSYFSKKDKKKQADEPVDEAASSATESETGQAYSRFTVKSPGIDEVIRANDGNVLVQLDIQPGLQNGHGVVFYLDGKQVGSGKSGSIQLGGVSRGQHSLFAVLHDQKNAVLTNTEAVNFQVLRATN